MELASSWLFWALLSAFFAAMTAILAKIGIERIDPDVATLARTLVIVALLAGGLAVSGKLRGLAALPAGSLVWLTLSGMATGASWICYFRALKLGQASQVAPVDKLSVVLVAVLGVLFLGENLSLGGWLGIALIAAGAVLVSVS